MCCFFQESGYKGLLQVKPPDLEDTNITAAKCHMYVLFTKEPRYKSLLNHVTWTLRPLWAERSMCCGSDTAAYEISVFADPRQLAKIVSIKWKN